MKFLDQIRGITQQIHKEPKDIFADIVGYEEVKKVFHLILDSEESGNALLDGPPACAKSLFLQAMKRKYKDAFYTFAGNASGVGMLDEVFDRKNTTHILIDEIDGLKANDQKALLNLIEEGILQSTKVRKGYYKEFKNLKVFATCNNMNKLSKALRSRMFRITLKEYTESQFIEIATKIYLKKDPELVEYVAKAVWKVIGSKDIRDFKHIMKSAKNSDDADTMIEVMLKYKPKEEEEDG